MRELLCNARGASSQRRATGSLMGILIVAITVSTALAALSAPAAMASFGVEESNFEAGTCVNASCTYASVKANPEEAFTQAAGHPPYGITTFEFKHQTGLMGEEPEGSVKNVRVDLPPGLAGNPEALPQCSLEAFQNNSCAADTQVGSNELVVFDGAGNLTVTGAVYNLEPQPGIPLDFGIHVAVEPLVSLHIYLEGHVSWSSDYHEYFEIKNIPKEGEVLGAKVPLSVLKSKLTFNGRAGSGDFLTIPSVCSNTTTSHLEVESWEGQVSRTQTHTPEGVSDCDKVPFKPTATVKAETAQSDETDGASTEVKVPQQLGGEEINTADIQDARVTLPEGMTLNPAAARGLQACTAAQIAIGSTNPVSCPAASAIGTVAIETDLPPGSLTGTLYLASPNGATITEPPYQIYLDAESVYGVSVRLKGSVTPNPSTGRLEVTFAENPQLPFSSLTLKAKGGAQAPLANPLACTSAPTEALFIPYSGSAAAVSSTPFAATGCASPLPFSLAQSTVDSSSNAGAYTSYTLSLARNDGQQYLSQIATTLPEGLLGAIPSVPLCGEPQASQGTCSATSQIGTASVTAGAGPQPYPFSGPVYLTGPYDGAPYGLSIAVPAAAGPFDLGSGPCNCVLTRAALTVNPYTTRVTASGSLPTIVKGVPLRLRTLSVALNRPNFLFNPTSCAPLATESTLTSTMGATTALPSALQVGNCNALAFKPTFKLASDGHASKSQGASLQATLTQPAHQANIHSVATQLPVQFAIRQSTLKYACPEATFAAALSDCPRNSKVGSATVTTPVLPGALTGHAYLVSHGGAAFPDLDLVLDDGGVQVILVGNNVVSKGLLDTTFAAIPDAPVATFALNLEMGPNSALAANGNLCAKALVVPTTITAQSGTQFKQSTRVSVSGCPPRLKILSRRLVGNKLVLKIRTYAAGRLTAGGRNLRAVARKLRRAQTITIKVPLSHTGVSALRHHRLRKLTVKVGLVPSSGPSSGSVSTTLKLRR
jgi:hypothetical protein